MTSIFQGPPKQGLNSKQNKGLFNPKTSSWMTFPVFFLGPRLKMGRPGLICK